MKKTLSLLLAIMMALALFAPAMAESDRCGGTLIAWLGGDPTSYNPDGAMDDFSLMTMENVFNKLIKFDFAGNLIPDLASSWEISEDGLTYTFHLVEAKWHDGEEFTADDVLWTLDSIKIYGITGYAFADVTAEKADDHTVVITLTQPDASLLYNLSYYGAAILPKHLYDGQDFYACDAAINHPIGTGPYKFVEHQQGVSVTLEANLDYFGDIAQTDTLVFSIIPDPSTAVQAFYAGELDYLGAAAPPSEFDNLRALGCMVYEQPFASRYYVAFNMREGNPATDLALRQAIAYGADRQAILNKALMGSGSIAYGFAPAAIAWAYNDQDIMPERDVEKAIAILEEAGYTKDADGYYVTLSAPTMTEFVDITNVLKDSLKDIGVNIVISSMEPAAWQEQVFSGNFDLTVLSGYHGPDASAMAMRVGTGGAVNIMAYSNADVDAYLAAGAATTDTEKRAEAYKAMQKVLSEELPIVPLCEAVITEVAAANLSDTPLSAPNVTSIGDLSHTRIN